MIILRNMSIESTKDNHRYNTRLKSKPYARKRYKESSDNSSSSSNEESDDDYNNEKSEINANYSKADYHELLAELFPSKFSKDKAKISKNFENKYKKLKLNPLSVDSNPENLDNLIILNINPKKQTTNYLDDNDSEYMSDSEESINSESDESDESDEKNKKILVKFLFLNKTNECKK